MRAINLRITDAARRRLTVYVDRCGISDAVPALLFAKQLPDVEERWTIGVYARARAEELEKLYATQGLQAVFTVDGIEVCIPQTQLLPTLEGRTLDATDKGLAVI